MLDKIDLKDIVNILKEEGDAIIEIYEKNFTVVYEDDNSPMTEVDMKSNEIICSALKNLYPNIPIISEKNKEVVSQGSSLKLCMVEEGTADIYPRVSPTMKWDNGAAHPIVIESGKKVVQYENGKLVIKNKENLLNPWFIVVGEENRIQ